MNKTFTKKILNFDLKIFLIIFENSIIAAIPRTINEKTKIKS